MEHEEDVVNLLADAWNKFIKLTPQHPNEKEEFADGIHRCQQLIALRFAREYRPDIFPIKK